MRLIDLHDDVIHLILRQLCPHCDGACGDSNGVVDPRDKIVDADAYSNTRSASDGDISKAQIWLMAFSRTCFRFHQLARPYAYHVLSFYKLDTRLVGDHEIYERASHNDMQRFLTTLSGSNSLHAGTSTRNIQNESLQRVFSTGLGVDTVQNIAKPGQRVLGSGFLDLAQAVRQVHITCFGRERNAYQYYSLLRMLLQLPYITDLVVSVAYDEDIVQENFQMLSRGREMVPPTNPRGTVKRLTWGPKWSDSLDFNFRGRDSLLGSCSHLEELNLFSVASISCARGLTNLTTLRLIDCGLPTEGLSRLLQGCTKLETFAYIRSNRPNMRRYISTNSTPQEVVVLLESHKDTLKLLELDYSLDWEPTCKPRSDAYMNEVSPLGAVQAAVIGSLRHFTRLQGVRLRQDMIMGPGPRDFVRFAVPGMGDEDGERLVNMLPPTLKTLCITGMTYRLSRSLLRFAASGERFPLLHDLGLRGKDTDTFSHNIPSVVSAYKKSADPGIEKDVLDELGRVFEERNVRLRFTPMLRERAFHPPSRAPRVATCNIG